MVRLQNRVYKYCEVYLLSTRRRKDISFELRKQSNEYFKKTSTKWIFTTFSGFIDSLSKSPLQNEIVSVNDYLAFSKLRCDCTNLYKTYFNLYISNINENINNNPRTFWKHFNNLKNYWLIPMHVLYIE